MEKTGWIEIATLIVLIITLLFVAGYTIITGYMASVAGRTARRQLRAYVTVHGGEIRLVNLVEGGMGLAVHVELRNSGQTPAYEFTTWIKPPLLLDPDAIPFGPATPLSDRTGASILAPNMSAHINWTLKITDEELVGVRNGSKKLFIWGGADFVDAFSEARFLMFRIVNSQGLLNQAGEVIGLSPHKAGYDAN